MITENFEKAQVFHPVLWLSRRETFDVLNSVLIADANSKDQKFSDFKSNYAGSRIDSEGNLIVFVTNKGQTVRSLTQELKSRNVKEEAFRFTEVQYSYNELKDHQKTMWDFRNELLESGEAKEWARKIASLEVDPTFNAVTIKANAFTPDDYKLCEEYFGDYSYRVEVIHGDIEVVEEMTVRPGNGISTGGTLGFRCKLNGVEGFVTAIHTSSYSSLNPIKVAGTSVGNITEAVYDGDADFAFVDMNSSTSASRVVALSPYNTLHASNYVISLPQGYTVYMAGNATGQRVTGTVEYWDGTVGNGTEWLKCKYSSTGGDSGGVIYANVNGDFCVVGIHNGVAGSYKYGTKLTKMKDYYNIDIY